MKIATRVFLFAATVLFLNVSALAQNTFGDRPVPPPNSAPPNPSRYPPQPQPNYPPSDGSTPGGGFGGYGPGQQPGSGPQPAPGRGGANLDQMMQIERQDFGIPPTKQLYSGQMHSPTPASIPGAQVITTKGLLGLLQMKQPYMLFDVLGGPETLPGAIPAVWVSQPGSFNDQIQQQFGQALQQGTRGNQQIPLVFYCLSSHCWMSYNAALRAVNLGYSNVLWYRGGIEAWQAAGQATQRAQQNNPPQQPGGYGQQPGGYPPQQPGGYGQPPGGYPQKPPQ